MRIDDRTAHRGAASRSTWSTSGAPMLSMHSARELMSTRDVEPTMVAFAAWLD